MKKVVVVFVALLLVITNNSLSYASQLPHTLDSQGDYYHIVYRDGRLSCELNVNLMVKYVPYPWARPVVAGIESLSKDGICYRSFCGLMWDYCNSSRADYHSIKYSLSESGVLYAEVEYSNLKSIFSCYIPYVENHSSEWKPYKPPEEFSRYAKINIYRVSVGSVTLIMPP